MTTESFEYIYLWKRKYLIAFSYIHARLIHVTRAIPKINNANMQNYKNSHFKVFWKETMPNELTEVFPSTTN